MRLFHRLIRIRAFWKTCCALLIPGSPTEKYMCTEQKFLPVRWSEMRPFLGKMFTFLRPKFLMISFSHLPKFHLFRFRPLSMCAANFSNDEIFDDLFLVVYREFEFLTYFTFTVFASRPQCPHGTPLLLNHIRHWTTSLERFSAPHWKSSTVIFPRLLYLPPRDSYSKCRGHLFNSLQDLQYF